MTLLRKAREVLRRQLGAVRRRRALRALRGRDPHLYK
jgi:hypothetical protein